MDAKGYMGETRVQALVLQLTDHSSRSPSGHEHCELITLIGDIMATRSILCYRTKD